MKQDICSIPIQEIFQEKAGCPLCRMRDMLEQRMAVYITGAAMMEPDVREETNRLGFCHLHFQQIAAEGNKLSVALILESLTRELRREIFGTRSPDQEALGERAEKGDRPPRSEKTGGAPWKRESPETGIQRAVAKRQESCFVCQNIRENMARLTGNMVQLWLKEEEFRQLYRAQAYLCLPHYGMAAGAGAALPKKLRPLYLEETRVLAARELDLLCDDVTHFCRMFDYRNKEADWGNSKTASARAVAYLTARPLE